MLQAVIITEKGKQNDRKIAVAEYLQAVILTENKISFP